MEALLHQLLLQFSCRYRLRCFVESRPGKTGEYSLPFLARHGAKANSHLDVAMGNKSPSHGLGGSCCPLGTRDGEKLANGALGDWGLAPSLFFLRLYLFIFRQRRRWGEREGEKHQCVVASWTPPTWDLACNASMCPDWELNQQHFGSQASTQPTETPQPGLGPQA